MKNLATSKEVLDAPLKGIAFLIAGVSVFSFQDVVIKWMSGEYPVHEIVFIRSLVAIVLILLIVRFEGGLESLWTRRPVVHLVRGCAFFMAYTCYYLSLASLPLAEAATLYFTAPLFLAALSVPLLGEKVGLQRWLAVCIGFLGVLIILRPGASVVDPASILALLSALAYAITGVVTRRLGGTDNSSSMAFYTTVLYLIVTAVIGIVLGDGILFNEGHASMEFLLRAWTLPSLSDLSLMVLLGLIAASGFYFLAQAYRVAQATTVAPFEYFGLLLAVIWGYTFWREFPDMYTIAGMLLVVGSGLYVLHCEALRKSVTDHRHGLRSDL
jgi:drug/metabolite transporter (DMT)-like permease